MRENAKHFALGSALMLLCVCFLVGYAVFSTREGLLEVAFLNVGQGDAVLITTPSRKQILIDGGRGTHVLRELGAVMPLFDRSLDMIVATHPDTDHIGGLVPVFERFAVTYFVTGGAVHDTDVARALSARVAASGATVYRAERGRVFDFGDGVVLTILFPDRSAPNLETNTASIVMRLTYADHAFLLTGDAPRAIEEYVLALDGALLESDVLKAGHHGSKTSSGDAFIGMVNPTYTVFSRGCENSYGHPHAEVVARFKRFGVVAYDTCTDGRIVFRSDGILLEKLE